MSLIIILIVLGLRQLWESDSPLHRDGWYLRWYSSIQRQPGSESTTTWSWALAVALPVLVVFVVSDVLPAVGGIALGVLVLSYSLGRGEYSETFLLYRSAVNGERWDDAYSRYQEAASGFLLEKHITAHDWPGLNKEMLRVMSYRGFERLFAGVFWFLFFGPAGALLYRLSVLNLSLPLDGRARESSVRWLWAIEWVPARLLAVSFAVTGNFVGCVNKLSASVLNTKISTASVVQQSVLGALSLDDVEVESEVVTLKDVMALKHLFSRTLWFWLAVLAAYLVFSGY